MQTGTRLNSYTTTLILLCIGYFIDFYDLTIFSANYHNIIHDLFHISQAIEVQQTYLRITNFYTFGIVCGGLLFGILGDKFGRSFVIRYSIIIYSGAIFLSIFTHSIYLFTFLRYISGFGLATEFATSSVLISELFDKRTSKHALSLLYASGILGGLAATFIGIFSWKIMFLFGSGAGFILFILRKKMFESREFLTLPHSLSKGNVIEIFANKTNLIKFLALLAIIIPFNFTISVMFIFPSIIHLDMPLARAIPTLLFCFFIGNLLSIAAYSMLRRRFNHPKKILLGNTLAFGIAMAVMGIINTTLFIPYCLILGFICGGLPCIWIETVAKNYPTHIRNTGTNILYIAGRGNTMIFNVLMSVWLGTQHLFLVNTAIAAILITIVSILGILKANQMSSRT